LFSTVEFRLFILKYIVSVTKLITMSQKAGDISRKF